MADYERRKRTVQAIQLVRAIFDASGRCLAEKGDWLVIEGRDQFYMTAVEFNEEFVQVQPYTPPSKPWRPGYKPGYDWEIIGGKPLRPAYKQDHQCYPKIGGVLNDANTLEIGAANQGMTISADGTPEWQTLSCSSNCVYESRE